MVALYPTQKSFVCLLLTTSYTAINIFIFGSCNQKPVSPCLFPCTLRPSHTPASYNARDSPRRSMVLVKWMCIWLEDSPTKCTPIYSLISPCPTAPSQEYWQTNHRHTQNPPSPERHRGRSLEKEQMRRTEQHWHRQSQLRPQYSQLQLQNGPGAWIFIIPLLGNDDTDSQCQEQLSAGM